MIGRGEDDRWWRWLVRVLKMRSFTLKCSRVITSVAVIPDVTLMQPEVAMACADNRARLVVYEPSRRALILATLGAALDVRLERLPPIKANRARFPVVPLPDCRTWESCWDDAAGQRAPFGKGHLVCSTTLNMPVMCFTAEARGNRWHSLLWRSPSRGLLPATHQKNAVSRRKCKHCPVLPHKPFLPSNGKREADKDHVDDTTVFTWSSAATLTLASVCVQREYPRAGRQSHEQGYRQSNEMTLGLKALTPSVSSMSLLKVSVQTVRRRRVQRLYRTVACCDAHCNELIPRAKWCGIHDQLNTAPQPEVRWCDARRAWWPSYGTSPNYQPVREVQVEVPANRSGEMKRGPRPAETTSHHEHLKELPPSIPDESEVQEQNTLSGPERVKDTGVKQLFTNPRVCVGVAPGFSDVGIVTDDAAGRRVFSGISRFPRPCIPALFHTHLASPTSALVTSMPGSLNRAIQGRGKRETPKKTCRPAASSDTIPTCGNLGVARPGIEPGSALVGGEQSNSSATAAPRVCNKTRFLTGEFGVGDISDAIGNTARLARRSDEALGVRVSVARIAPSLLDLGRRVPTGGAHPTLKLEGNGEKLLICVQEFVFGWNIFAWRDVGKPWETEIKISEPGIEPGSSQLRVKCVSSATKPREASSRPLYCLLDGTSTVHHTVWTYQFGPPQELLRVTATSLIASVTTTNEIPPRTLSNNHSKCDIWLKAAGLQRVGSNHEWTRVWGEGQPIRADKTPDGWGTGVGKRCPLGIATSADSDKRGEVPRCGPRPRQDRQAFPEVPKLEGETMLDYGAFPGTRPTPLG
ncbi:hypothetical protein PR048_003213 [Dryococelus australis]|uniref:Uncharacterized protein n=1 Tax=Dryococelus australis TaxID=614101 RepID=A0ABQ9IMC6_9NEOP|nr:hypothetical protein PR048_003213 [Dryococelus australis]